MKNLVAALCAGICLFCCEGAFTSQVDPPPDHLVVMAKVRKVGVKADETKKSDAIDWKVEGVKYELVVASVVEVLEANSWNKDEALKFKMDLFVKVPKEHAKVGRRMKIWVQDQRHPGSFSKREIETSFDQPSWWMAPPEPPK